MIAYLIKPDNEKVEIKPKSHRFHLKEISEYIDGLVEPLFVGKWWLFKSRTRKGLKKNSELSEKMNIPIYGNCLLIDEDLLEPYFFFPEELILATAKEIAEKKLSELHIDPLKDENEEMGVIDTVKEAESKRFIYNDTYDAIFSGKNITSILREISIYDDGYRRFNIAPSKQLEFLYDFLDFFIEKEEYEKCEKIKKVIEQVEKKNGTH